MDLNETYNQLKTLNLTTSQRHFSTEFLSKSPSYLSMIIATKRQPSLTALIRLSKHLSAIADDKNRPLAEHLYGMSREVLNEVI